MDVNYVGRPSLVVLTLENMKESTLDINHMGVNCVERPSLVVLTLKNMKEFTLE